MFQQQSGGTFVRFRTVEFGSGHRPVRPGSL